VRFDSASPERTMSSTTPDDADSQPDEQAVLSHLVRRLLQREGDQIPLERVTLRVRSTVGLPFSLPRVESFSEFLQNALTGLGIESFVFWMGLGFQLVFEVAVVGNPARFIPDLSGVVVGDVARLYLTGSQTESENVPEFRCTPPVPVKRFL
jgi:hypothetical protein